MRLASRSGLIRLAAPASNIGQPIIERYGLSATVVNKAIDPTFRFMTLDWDGRVRMDCSSPYAMKRLIGMRDKFDVAFANDTDADRHGIVTRPAGLMNPNHFLAIAISYLFANRPDWSRTAVSARRSSAAASSIASSPVSVASSSRRRSGSNGSSTACWMALWLCGRGERRRLLPEARRLAGRPTRMA